MCVCQCVCVVKGHTQKLYIWEEKKGGKYFNNGSLYISLLSKVNKEPTKYYTEVIRNELAGKIGKVSTYVYCRDSVDQIVEKHSYMHNAKVIVAEDTKRLPGFYWMPKLHRNPYGHLHNETFI